MKQDDDVGQVVSVLAFYSDNLSSNPAKDNKVIECSHREKVASSEEKYTRLPTG